MDPAAIPGQTFLGKALRLPLELIPRSAVFPILQGPLRGKKWIARSADHGCWVGSYELPKQRAMAAAMGPADVLYDIGANVGFYTLLGATRCARVCAFEPVEANLKFLHRHLELNGVANCEVIAAAVGERDGTAGFDPGADRRQGSLKAGAAMQVPVVSLDSLLEQGRLPPPTILKIDIEGAELDCLRGAERVLAACKPKIFLATHTPSLWHECPALLRSWGYRVEPLPNMEGEFLATPNP